LDLASILGALGIRFGEQVAHWGAWQSGPGISFKLAFVFMAALTLIGWIKIWRLKANAGHSVSGSKRGV